MRWMLVPLALLAIQPAWAVSLASPTDPYDHVTLSASAGVDVTNDVMRAGLFVEAEGSAPAAMADRVNRIMNEALRTAAAVPGVQAQSTGYQTEPLYTYDDKTRQTRITGWRIRQSLQLQSRDFTALKKLVGRLQGQLKLDSLSFGVSPEARQAAENLAITRALAAFRARATLIQRALKTAAWRIERLDVSLPGDEAPIPPRPMMATAAGMAAPTAPDAAPGNSIIEAVVSGDIHLDR